MSVDYSYFTNPANAAAVKAAAASTGLSAITPSGPAQLYQNGKLYAGNFGRARRASLYRRRGSCTRGYYLNGEYKCLRRRSYRRKSRRSSRRRGSRRRYSRRR